MPLTPLVCKPRATRWTYLVGVGLLGLAGCVPEDAGYDVDPMKGGPSIPRNKAVAPPGQQAGATGELPGLPSPQASTSPAAAAGGITQTLPPSSDGSYNLAIPGNSGPPNNSVSVNGWRKPADTVDNQDPLAGPVNVNVNLQKPTNVVANSVSVSIAPATGNTVPVPSIPGNPLPAINPAGGLVRVDTYKDAQDQLAARGANSQQLRQIGNNGVWEFRCSVPNAATPGLNNVILATAPGENGVAAMRQAIQEIDARKP